MHVREAGSDGEAPHGTIVFLHGFPFDGSMWSPQLDDLPPGWRGLAPDLRGFGKTELDALPGEVSTGKRIGGRIARGSEPVITMARLADDVAELIQERAGGSAVVCGLSMGGYVALELLRRHPETVRALVLADTRAGADDDEARENRLRVAQTARSGGTDSIAGAMVPSLLAKGTAERAPGIAGTVSEMIVGTSTDTFIAALAGMAARHDSGPLLRTIAVPTLVLVGAQDAITPPTVAREMAAAIPNATIFEIPEAGHLSNMENPAVFNRRLGDFLRGA